MHTSYTIHAASSILAAMIARKSAAQDVQSGSLESFHQSLTTIDTLARWLDQASLFSVKRPARSRRTDASVQGVVGLS